MPTVPLPDEPSLEQLRNQARDLQRAVRREDPDGIAEVADRYPEAPFDAAAIAAFPLSAAQLVVARRYGFTSWSRLKGHVEVIAHYSRFPARMVASEPVDPADRFLRLACLSYDDDDGGPSAWAQARELVAGHPEIVGDDVHVAAAVGDAAALDRLLAADPRRASREGGPYRWEPLFYLAYARHDPEIAADAVLASARRLLDAGADPNAGYLWHGLPTPFTVLTGVFGEGEQGPVVHPRHPHSVALGRLLLDAGADPNDGQALYNRMFGPDDDHLALLLEYGLGTGDGGPWRRRLGDELDTPTELVRGQLSWAVTHGMVDRVRLLADHGVDLVAPFPGGLTPAIAAATAGRPDVVELLVARGAPRPDLDPAEAFVAAALAADRATVDRLRHDDGGLVDRVRADRPALVVWAAAAGGAPAVEMLVELGFDVDAMGRSDIPSDQPWQTALHKAAEDGDVDLARTLLRLGADPDIRDLRFDSTPLGWARHLGREQVVELLEPVTRPDPAADAGDSGG